MTRSIGVTVIGVLSMLGSLLTFAMGMLMVVAAIFMPTKDPSMPPAVMKGILILASAMYVLPAIWGACTSVGLFRLKNWARISTIVFSILLILMSGFAGLMLAVMSFLPIAGPSTDASVTIVVRVVMGLFWAVQLGIGIWWLAFFTRAKVKAQFVPPAPAFSESAPRATEYQIQTADVQLVPAKKVSGRPVSITVIACLLLAGCLFIPMSAIMRAPAIFFTKIYFGWTAALVFLAFAGLQLYVGIGLLRLQPTARLVGIAYFVFGTANSTVFFLAPGANTRISAMMAWQESLFPFGQFSPIQTQFQFDLTPFYVIGAILGVAGAAVQIYFLATRKAAFYKGTPSTSLT